MSMDERTLLAEASAFAVVAHGDQRRKTGALYVAHLFDVASLLLSDLATIEAVAAGLLHDTVEDTEVTAQDIAERFGGEVASIVELCSEHRDGPPVTWRERKEAHVARLASCGDQRALQVTAADKLSNVNSVLNHIAIHGAEDTFSLFKGGREDSVWYYRAMSEVVSAQLTDSTLPPRLAAAVSTLSDRAGI